MKLPLTTVAIAALVMACTPAEEAAIDTAALQTSPGADTAMAPTTPDAAAARTVHVELSEWRVSPSETSLPPGAVMFHAMNQGQYLHGLEIEGAGQEAETGNIPAGGTGSVTMQLQPGTYTLYCPVVDAQGNHRQRGMQTTITVR